MAADSEAAKAGMHTTLHGYDTRFGQFGTLAAVSAVTAAIKGLANESAPDAGDAVQLCGYSGLMLPVMEDCILAARASGHAGAYPHDNSPSLYYSFPMFA